MFRGTPGAWPQRHVKGEQHVANSRIGTSKATKPGGTNLGVGERRLLAGDGDVAVKVVQPVVGLLAHNLCVQRHQLVFGLQVGRLRDRLPNLRTDKSEVGGGG